MNNWADILKVKQITTPITDINIKKIPKKKKSNNCWDELKAMNDSWTAQTTLIHPSIVFKYYGMYNKIDQYPVSNFEEIACAFLDEIRRYQLTASNQTRRLSMETERDTQILPAKGGGGWYDWTYNLGWYTGFETATFCAALYYHDPEHNLKRVYWRLCTTIRKHPQAPFVEPPGNIMNNMWAILYDLHHDEEPTINTKMWISNPLDDSDTDKLLAAYFDWRK